MSALRRHLGTLVLVALALAAGVVLFLDRGSISTDEAAHRKGSLLPAWRRDDVTRVSVEREGHTARLTRADAKDGGARPWELELDGQRFPADEQAVDDYLGRLEFAQTARTIPPDGVDRKAFHLDDPSLVVEVAMGAQSYRLALGGTAPTPAGASYAEVADHGVSVVTAQLAAALAVNPTIFRSRSFVPYLSVDVAKILLDGDGGPRHLERAPWAARRGAGFRFDGSTGEGHVRVDAEMLDRVLVTLGRLEAESFLSDADADRALDERVTLRLVPKASGAKDATIELGGACPGHADQVVAVRREPTRASACVSKDALDVLSTPASDFVDRHVVGAPLDEIVELEVTRGGDKLDMARKGTGFYLRVPTARDVDAEAGKAFTSAILDVKLGALDVDASKCRMDAPVGTLRVVSSEPSAMPDGDSAERVELVDVGPDDHGTTCVRRREDGALGSLPTDAARALLPSELALRSHRVLDEPDKRFRSLRITSGPLVQALHRVDNGGWALDLPKAKGLAPDAGLASDVVAALGRLDVERWVEGGDDPRFGLAAPRLVVEAVLADDDADAGGEKHVRLALGTPTSGGSYAKLDGDAAVFVAPRALEDAASRLLIDRTALTIEPSAVARVTFTSAKGAKKLVLVHDGDAWRVDGARGPDASAKAAALRDAVSDLLAEGAVGLGAAKKPEGLDAPQLTIAVELRDGGAPVRITVGAGDVFRGTSVFYARRDGVDATYALAQGKIRPILDALDAR
jgi:hypothetical protein